MGKDKKDKKAKRADTTQSRKDVRKRVMVMKPSGKLRFTWEDQLDR